MGPALIQSLSAFQWRVFVPVFLLFFSYVFGVATQLLGEAQLFIRLLVVLFILVSMCLSKIKISVSVLIIYLLILIYLSLFYLVSNNVITLNFIYLTIILYFLYALKISHSELLFNSMLASLVIVLLYLIYFFIGYIDLGETAIGGRVRYSFGFSNPNKVGIVTYSLIILISLYSFKKNNSFIFTLLLNAPFFFIMIYSDSRTALYSIIIFFILILMPFLAFLRRFLFLLPIILLILSLSIAYFYDNDMVNNLLSFRPRDFYSFLDNVSSVNYLIGANSNGFRVDNSYILAVFSVGFLGFVLISYFLYRIGVRRVDMYDVSFFVSVLTYGVFEGVLVRVEFPIILYFYYLIITPGKFNAAVYLNVQNRE